MVPINFAAGILFIGVLCINYMHSNNKIRQIITMYDTPVAMYDVSI
jgi:hypothetical protein